MVKTAPALTPRFWETTPLEEMSRAEWEALCDGCGRCCLLKLEDEETGELAFTNVICNFFDEAACNCSDYARRHVNVPSCIPLDADNVHEISWLPVTCAYRLLAEGEPLYWWHHLLSGSRDTIHQAGISVKGRVVKEANVPEDALEYYIVTWPEEDGEESA